MYSDQLTATVNNYFPLFQGFQDVIEYFAETLNSVTTKMVIILDSLDQLSSQDGAFNFKWMPKKINRKVTFILSTIPNAEFKVFPVLQVQFILSPSVIFV